MLCTALYPDPLKYSTRHMKMDSASRVTLEANLARNASHRASRVSLDNKLRVVYSYASGTTYHQQSSKCLANFASQIIEREMSVPRVLRDSRFLSNFMCCVRVVYCTTYCTMLWSITVNLWRAPFTIHRIFHCVTCTGPWLVADANFYCCGVLYTRLCTIHFAPLSPPPQQFHETHSSKVYSNWS